ncbi:MAG: cysteine desulfurase, partial [Planctomycetota bacterium]
MPVRTTRGRARVTSFLTNAAEHPSVLDVAKRLKRQGLDVTILPVDHHARVDPQRVADAISPQTRLVSVMLANNEVGTINPIAEIGRLCRERGVLLHCDAVQAVGKISVDLQQLPVDLLSLSAHKFHGPKGVGALIVRRDGPRIPLEPLFDGGRHEQHLRSGTLPVPLIVGFGTACELAKLTRSASEGDEAIGVCDDSPSLALRVSVAGIAALRDQLWQRLQAELEGLSLNGPPLVERLPNNLNFSVAGVDGEALMSGLKEIAVSSGSACSTAEPEPSHVLRAMGVPEVLSRTSLRFGLSRYTTEAEIDIAVAEVVRVVKQLR